MEVRVHDRGAIGREQAAREHPDRMRRRHLEQVPPARQLHVAGRRRGEPSCLLVEIPRTSRRRRRARPRGRVREASRPGRARAPPGRRPSAARGPAPSSACADRAARARRPHGRGPARGSRPPPLRHRAAAATPRSGIRPDAAPENARTGSRPRRRAAARRGRRRPRTAHPARCSPCAASPDSIRRLARRTLSSWMRCAPRSKDRRWPAGACCA